MSAGIAPLQNNTDAHQHCCALCHPCCALQRGALQLLTPAQMAEARQEAQRKWDEGMAEVWRLLAQLDETTDIKSLASALLDPVALQKVARLHRKVGLCCVCLRTALAVDAIA